MEKAEFELKEPKTKIKCSVVDEGHALLCSVDDVTFTVTPRRLIVKRPPFVGVKPKFKVSEDIGKPELIMGKVWVEWV